MNKPPYMPDIFWSIYLDMDARGKLTQKKKLFFLNKELKNFWVKAGKYIDEVEISSGHNAASEFVGCFFTPLGFYDIGGTAETPSTKTTIRKNQLEADKLINTALTLTNDLIDTLQKVEDLTGHYPDALDFLTLLENMEIDGITLPNDSSPSWKISTIDALIKLNHGLMDHPEMAEIFKNSPGIIGQKASWVDWLVEAENHISRLKKTFPGTLDLTLNDWANVYVALINIEPRVTAKIARDSYIKSAFERIKKDKLQREL